MIQISVFALLLVGGVGFFSWNINKIRQNISLGRKFNRTDRAGDRWKTMILVALGQKKMFSRKKWRSQAQQMILRK